jgi:hypothetical protein
MVISRSTKSSQCENALNRDKNIHCEQKLQTKINIFFYSTSKHSSSLLTIKPWTIHISPKTIICQKIKEKEQLWFSTTLTCSLYIFCLLYSEIYQSFINHLHLPCSRFSNLIFPRNFPYSPNPFPKLPSLHYSIPFPPSLPFIFSWKNINMKI